MPRNTIQKKKKNISVTSQLNLFSGEKKKKRRKKILKRIKKVISQLGKHSNIYKYYVGAGLIVILGYIFFFSSLFTVKEIYIYRVDSLSNIDAAYRSLNYIRGDNIYFVDPGIIVSRLKNTQKAIKYIDISKKIPNTIEITLESFAPLFRIGNTLALENGSIVQNNGIIRDSLPELSLFPEPSDDESLNFKHLEKILLLTESLRKNILGLQIGNIQYHTDAEEVLLRINNELILIFDIEKDLVPQIKKLTVYNSEKNDILIPFAVYIDLRIDGKIFTCENENVNSCRNNITNIYDNDYFNFSQENSSEIGQ